VLTKPTKTKRRAERNDEARAPSSFQHAYKFDYTIGFNGAFYLLLVPKAVTAKSLRYRCLCTIGTGYTSIDGRTDGLMRIVSTSKKLRWQRPLRCVSTSGLVSLQQSRTQTRDLRARNTFCFHIRGVSSRLIGVFLLGAVSVPTSHCASTAVWGTWYHVLRYMKVRKETCVRVQSLTYFLEHPDRRHSLQKTFNALTQSELALVLPVTLNSILFILSFSAEGNVKLDGVGASNLQCMCSSPS